MNQKIKLLDGLRGCAALFVVLAHLPQITDSTIGILIKNALSFSRIAYISVDIFFILSGFLITRNMIKDKKNGKFSFTNFYIKRAFRIFPIYYISILAVGIIISWDHLSYVALYLSNYYFSINTEPNAMRHTWSLAVEEHFYMIWPAIVFLFSKEQLLKYWKLIMFLLIITSVVFFYSYFSIETASKLVDKSTNTRFLSLILGALIAYKEKELRTIKNINMLLIISIISYSIAIGSRLLNIQIPYIAFLYVFSAIGSVSFFLYVLNSENKSNLAYSIFGSKLLVFLGSISYGLYLYHYSILYYFGLTNLQLDKAPIEYISVFELLKISLIIIVITLVSYYYVEKPLMKYKEKFIR